MGGKRKNQKRASSSEEDLDLGEGRSIMLVTSLRGSNLIEVMDAEGIKSLALFPAKFQKSVWIKRGSFVIVDESGREKALESGGKITCMVLQVLFHEQVCKLQRSPEWPEVFKATPIADDYKKDLQGHTGQLVPELDLEEDDDGLPPLEANLNRNRPVELYSDSDSS